MARYLETLRGSRPVAGGMVMAPGDREWAEADRRVRDGIPIDRDTAAAFDRLAAAHGVARPAPLTPS